MSTRQSHVVVAYDFSQCARAAFDRAIVLATRAPFHVLDFACIVEPHTPNVAIPGKHVDFAYTEQLANELTEAVRAALVQTNPEGAVHFNVHVRIGKPAEEIMAVARGVGADLIIVGSKGLKGLERLMLGSVAERVVREAECPVMVARPKTYPEVDLLDIYEVERQGHYVRPHRYYYEDTRIIRRPKDWPLY